jgi:response regulator NasT
MSKRILICEDEGITTLRLTKSLASLGYEVVGDAKNGEEAIRLAQELQPDLILMDIRMPRVDGIQAAKAIMERSPVPIVMLTAFSEQPLIDAALAAGACGYLVKPVSDEHLELALRVAATNFQQLQHLQTEIADLKEALEVRKQVERAKGILMQRQNLSEAEAFQRMQKISRDRRQTMKETAEQILQAAELLG